MSPTQSEMNNTFHQANYASWAEQMRQWSMHCTAVFYWMLPRYGYQASFYHVQQMASGYPQWFQAYSTSEWSWPTSQPCVSDATSSSSNRDCRTVFVTNVPSNITEAALHCIFKAVGAIQCIRISRDDKTQEARHALVSFYESEASDRAVDLLNFYMSSLTGYLKLYVERAECDPSKRVTRDRKVFIKGLRRHVTEESLYDTFSQIGNVRRSDVKRDAQGKSLGYGYILFETAEAARAAIKCVNGKLIMGMKVHLSPFRNKREKNWEMRGEKGYGAVVGKEDSSGSPRGVMHFDRALHRHGDTLC